MFYILLFNLIFGKKSEKKSDLKGTEVQLPRPEPQISCFPLPSCPGQQKTQAPILLIRGDFFVSTR